jgi:hypothetical protein
MEMTLFDFSESINYDNLQVRPISRATAASWCSKYHYLEGAGSANWNYGVYTDDLNLVCVVVLTMPANLHGVAAKYGLSNIPGNIEITRVATRPNAPKNTTSRCIAMAMKAYALETGNEWVFSYADTGQNHHGGIYQALNAIYVGKTKAASGFILDGKVIHSRTIGRHFGSSTNEALEVLRSKGVKIERAANVKTPKHLYILPIGNASSRKKIKKILQPFTLDYPKRDVL